MWYNFLMFWLCFKRINTNLLPCCEGTSDAVCSINGLYCVILILKHLHIQCYKIHRNKWTFGWIVHSADKCLFLSADMADNFICSYLFYTIIRTLDHYLFNLNISWDDICFHGLKNPLHFLSCRRLLPPGTFRFNCCI